MVAGSIAKSAWALRTTTCQRGKVGAGSSWNAMARSTPPVIGPVSMRLGLADRRADRCVRAVGPDRRRMPFRLGHDRVQHQPPPGVIAPDIDGRRRAGRAVDLGRAG